MYILCSYVAALTILQFRHVLYAHIGLIGGGPKVSIGFLTTIVTTRSEIDQYIASQSNLILHQLLKIANSDTYSSLYVTS